jgi:pimeloyl-ACP methyl ester carboxylesterase
MNSKYFLIVSTVLVFSSCTHNIKKPAVNGQLSIVNDDGAETVFYLTKPNQQKFPIAVLCEGSTSANDIESVWSFHNFEQFSTLSEMGLGILTIEKDGGSANAIDKSRFFANYTRSKRFRDHVAVIDHLLKNPPSGFDGRLIFIGASEGGPLVNQLSLHYPQTIATINWSGAGDWPWPDEIWAWGEQVRKENPILASIYGWWHKIPKTREGFDSVMAETIHDPSDKRWFLGMTYRYHADAIKTPLFQYYRIHAPMLVVCATKDSLINSCDDFVVKAKSVSAPITYWRVEGMEHRISQNKGNLIPKSFEWLSQWL